MALHKPLKKILLIVNPYAGKKLSKNRIKDIVNIFRQNGLATTVCQTKNKNHATHIVTKCAAKHDFIVCCGGDGTLNEVITGIFMLPQPLPVGYIPTGTTNDMASNLNLPRNVKKAAENIAHGTPVSQDIGRFNHDRYFSYVASFGALTEVSYTTSQQAKNILGYLAYVLEGILAIHRIHSCHMKIQAGERIFEDDFIFGAVTNSKTIAGMLKLPQKEFNLNDGVFEVMLIRKPKNESEFRSIVFGLIRKDYHNRCFSFFHTSQIQFNSSEAPSWVVDGEYAGNQHTVVIENLRGTIQFIRS